MTTFITRAYNKIELDKTNTFIVKSSKESRLADEIEYYSKIPSQLALYFPRYYPLDKENEEYKLKLEFYAYQDLGKLLISDAEININQWESIFNFLFSYLEEYKKLPAKDSSGIVKNCNSMYVNKTETEYNALISKFPYFNRLASAESIKLNGVNLFSFNRIWPRIKEYLQSSECIPEESFFIHGDLCFANILYGIINNIPNLKFVDPRGKFGDGLFGDVYYDLAKLNHNLTVNHDIVSKNLFNPSSNNCYILTNSTLNECKEILHSFITENLYDLKKVRILTSLIWINMAPLHEYPFNNFLFNFGKYNLYKNLK